MEIGQGGHGLGGCAGIVALGIAEPAGVVDLVAAKAQVGGGGRGNVVVSNVAPLTPMTGHLPPLLRGVVFLGQPHLGAGLDQQRVALRPVDGGQ